MEKLNDLIKFPAQKNECFLDLVDANSAHHLPPIPN